MSANEEIIAELRRERDEANARRADMRMALVWANEERDRLQRERDEAVERCNTLRELADAASHEQGLAQRRMMEAQRERDEARAEVKRMKARPVEAEHTRLDIMWQQLVRERDDAYRAKRDAYRRGAEAMREACAQEVVSYTAWSDPPSLEFLEEQVRALPIPEER